LRLTQIVLLYCFLILVSFNGTAANDITKRNALKADELQSSSVSHNPLSMKYFSAQGQHSQPSYALQGSFTFSINTKLTNLRLTEDSDVYQFEKRTRPEAFSEQRKTLPKMIVAFVQFDNKIIPVNRQLQTTKHPHWDFIVGTGNIWQEVSDGKFSRIAMPFSLVEKNQNCVHNGALTFLIDDEGKTSQFYYQISSETCLYYKVDLWGKGYVYYQSEEAVNDEFVINQYKQEMASRMPKKQIEGLKEHNKAINISKIAMTNSIRPTDMSSFGVIYNGTYYASKCQTRFGRYPFCQQLVLPSYSTAKSIFAGIAMMYLAKDYPTIFEEEVSNWVKECQGDNWQGVTLGHLVNMATGNYQSIGHSADEAAEHSQRFFKAANHQDKINYSCRQFSRKSPPGSTFVYHTSDTYLLGVALSAFLKNKLVTTGNNITNDLFDIIFKQRLWPKLNLSSVAYSTRKTTDKWQQPFVGYGLLFTQDDIAKLTQFLIDELTQRSNFLAQEQVYDTLHRNQSNKEMRSQYPFIHYINGFWKRDVTELLQCEKETWLPYLLGYGGINIVLAKNNLQYFYFSDSDHYLWQDAIKELNTLTSLCRN